jgi:hypothetical protein
MLCLPLHWRPADTDAKPTVRETSSASASDRENQRVYVTGSFIARADD